MREFNCYDCLKESPCKLIVQDGVLAEPSYCCFGWQTRFLKGTGWVEKRTLTYDKPRLPKGE